MRRSTMVSMAVGLLLLFAAGCTEDTSSTSTSRSASPTAPKTTASPTRSSPPTAWAGQVAQCPKGSTPNRPGQTSQGRPALGYNPLGPPVAMDTESGQVVAWDSVSMSTWTLDVCTNTWKAMKPAQEPRSMVRRLVYDTRWGVVIAFTDFAFYEGRVTTGVWTYVVDTNTWTELPSPTLAQGIQEYSRQHLVYDSRSGMVLSLDMATMALWAYDLARNTWTKVPETGQVPGERDLRNVYKGLYPSFVSYDSVAGRLVLAIAGGGTWLFDPTTGVWTKEAITPRIPAFWGWAAADSGTDAAFDDAHRRTVIYSLGLLATYDAATHTWTTVPHIPPVSPAQPPDEPLVTPGPLARADHTLVYDPINKRILMFGGHSLLSTGWRKNYDVLAYDLETNTWTTIVPAAP